MKNRALRSYFSHVHYNDQVRLGEFQSAVSFGKTVQSRETALVF